MSRCVKGQIVLATTEFSRSWFCSELYLTRIPNICVVKGFFIKWVFCASRSEVNMFKSNHGFIKNHCDADVYISVLVVFQRETQKGTLLLQSHQISNQVFISSRNFSRESSVTKLLRFLACKWGMACPYSVERSLFFVRVQPTSAAVVHFFHSQRVCPIRILR